MNSLIYLLALTTCLASKALAAQCNVYGDGDNYYRTFKASSTLDCMSGCVSDSRCQSSEFRPDNGNCWLYDVPVSGAKKRDSPSRTWVFNDRDCLPQTQYPQCGVKGDGNHYYKTFKRGTRESCMRACVADSQCRSSEYRPDNGNCWLYAMSVSQAKIKDDPSGTWYMSDRDCQTPAATEQCSAAGDGDDFYKHTNEKYDLWCRQSCRDDKKCQSSEYREQTGDCWLYSMPVEDAMTRPGAGRGLYYFMDRTCRLSY